MSHHQSQCEPPFTSFTSPSRMGTRQISEICRECGGMWYAEPDNRALSGFTWVRRNQVLTHQPEDCPGPPNDPRSFTYSNPNSGLGLWVYDCPCGLQWSTYSDLRWRRGERRENPDTGSISGPSVRVPRAVIDESIRLGMELLPRRPEATPFVRPVQRSEPAANSQIQVTLEEAQRPLSLERITGAAYGLSSAPEPAPPVELPRKRKYKLEDL